MVFRVLGESPFGLSSECLLAPVLAFVIFLGRSTHDIFYLLSDNISRMF